MDSMLARRLDQQKGLWLGLAMNQLWVQELVPR